MSYPLCQAPEHFPHQILKGGRRLLCANLVDLVSASVTRGRGPVTDGAVGMSARHEPSPTTRGYGATPGLSAEHRPLCVARDRGLVATTAPGL